MPYFVRFTGKAQTDLDGILTWFGSQRSRAAGERWFDGLERLTETLTVRPDRCPAVFSIVEAGRTVRELLYGRGRVRYRLLFAIKGETVWILRVYHSARPDLRPDDL